MRDSTAPTLDPTPGSDPSLTVRLLDLVSALIDTGANDRQVVAAVMHLVETGRVRLIGQVWAEDLLAP